MEKVKVVVLEDILSQKDIQDIINAEKPGSLLVDYNLKPAAEGLAGFVAEHYRLTLNVRDDTSTTTIFLFIKALPIINKTKAKFILEFKFFDRESLMYQLFDEMQENEDLNPWHTKAYVRGHNVAMPDLFAEGYKTHPMETTFDLNHVLVSVASIARFHASFANFINKKSAQNPYSILSEYGDIMEETHFRDSPYVRAGAKVTYNFLKEFSSKWTQYPKNLLEQLEKLYITGCCSLKEYEETLNVVVHRDLWVNNILFKYKGDVPTNAVLIDYQCIRYGPPAFDIMEFLYLNTTRAFRESHENGVLNYYFTVFTENLNDETKSSIRYYDLDVFLSWCDKARLFGIVYAAILLPSVLLDSVTASKYYDDPDTFIDHVDVDRSYFVLTYAKENDSYKHRLLNTFEELVDKYILSQQINNN